MRIPKSFLAFKFIPLGLLYRPPRRPASPDPVKMHDHPPTPFFRVKAEWTFWGCRKPGPKMSYISMRALGLRLFVSLFRSPSAQSSGQVGWGVRVIRVGVSEPGPVLEIEGEAVRCQLLCAHWEGHGKTRKRSAKLMFSKCLFLL